MCVLSVRAVRGYCYLSHLSLTQVGSLIKTMVLRHNGAGQIWLAVTSPKSVSTWLSIPAHLFLDSDSSRQLLRLTDTCMHQCTRLRM